MLCRKPFRNEGMEYGCGQCLPCRFNQRRIWTSRLMLESFQHGANTFATLTLAEEYLAYGDSVSVREVQLFLKRLRARLGKAGLRFFAVGEYGEERGRPHYHLALFNLRSGHPDGIRGRCGCEICGAWRYGDVHTYQLSHFLAQYLAGYVVDKVYAAGPYSRVDGRAKEFQRMSLRPGIGAPAMATLRDAIVDKDTGEIRLVDGDVISAFRMDRKLWPLGRYLRGVLRKRLGMSVNEPAAAAELRKLSELLEYPTWQARERREEGREQGARIAHARYEISRSLKKL